MAGVPMAMNQSCYAIQGKNGYPPFFVYAFTKSIIATMKKKASGAVFSALVIRDFNMEKVTEPTIADVAMYQKRVAPIFNQILSNTKEIQLLLNYNTLYYYSFQAARLSFAIMTLFLLKVYSKLNKKIY